MAELWRGSKESILNPQDYVARVDKRTAEECVGMMVFVEVMSLGRVCRSSCVWAATCLAGTSVFIDFININY
jgi:hypothetical protein